MKVDIVNSDSKLKQYYDYCCLRAEDDGVYFIAWGGRQEHTEKAGNFKIIKYSWDGVPEKILAGTLPFEFEVTGGSRHFYANLLIEKDYCYFSVYKFDADDFLYGPNVVQPIYDYRFCVPNK